MEAPPTRSAVRSALRSLLFGAFLASSFVDSYSASPLAFGDARPRDRMLHRPETFAGPGKGHTSEDGRHATGRREMFGRSASAFGAATAMAIHPRAARAASPTPPLGSPAPDFSLISSRGQTVTLDALAKDGKWTVLYFFPGAFTSGCTIEARKFQEALPQFREANAQVVGVSVDGVSKNAEFCSSEGLEFFMLTDEGGRVSKSYGTALSIPGFGTFSNRQTYILDPQKAVRWVFVDVESRIPKHAEEVLEKLRVLQQA